MLASFSRRKTILGFAHSSTPHVSQKRGKNSNKVISNLCLRNVLGWKE
uniref:Uncharacterized protein n=1 Tax=Arundo donax TaxID=35708 RepID=A0A0A9E1P6_ARUDO